MIMSFEVSAEYKDMSTLPCFTFFVGELNVVKEQCLSKEFSISEIRELFEYSTSPLKGNKRAKRQKADMLKMRLKKEFFFGFFFQGA